ncbi:MAG: tripartite tricarboxylate transporter substrate binding protein [Reyranella sp.]|uniref:Bug family tripartite tricarboxylate transporter substrate binding protein n=1 Tax=Reyranella sp. TaxID=1929291 RepID=UPI001ACEB927|nr:tripartite tricarboxylate transporter substrate binding protein [Reyranella sp.]MBN9085558.1 tripartite tricarboxylate transporter substrate binding protein [Reyranella sp.]
MLRRRTFQRLAASVLATPMIAGRSRAQSWSAQPVRMMVGYAAGQSIDILARLVAQSLSEQFSQQFIVENKPGAGGNIAAEGVARATPDGHTLLVIGANNPINTTLYDKLAFDLLRDVAPVAGIYRVYQVMVVNPSFPARTGAAFIAYAKAHPGKINYGSAGTGSVAHVSGELFKMMAGVDMQHVPYRGAPLALADLLGGQVQVMFDNLPSSIDHVRNGRLRALGVSTPQPLELLPDVPPIATFVPGYETSAFAGLGAPASTPREIVDKLGKGVATALADAKIKAKILDLGGVPMTMTPPEFGRFLAEETEKWGKVIRAANIKPT